MRIVIFKSLGIRDYHFHITRKCSQTGARAGVYTTPHGKFHTPAFMPVGTCGAVKTVTPLELQQAGAEIILANALHLYLRPGLKVIEQFGGVRAFMRYAGPLLTDSGGFQIFSLAKLRRVYADKVVFHSPFDGSRHILTPQQIWQIQQKLGVTIAMQLDECVGGDASRSATSQALTRTQQWAEQSFCLAQQGSKQAGPELFPIIQGGRFLDLRRQSADFCAQLPTSGLAVGGLAVGESKVAFQRVLAGLAPHLPTAKIHYLMGVGDPQDILFAVTQGIDLFDCVLPTRLARHGVFLAQTGGKINLRQARFRTADQVLQKDCPCLTCQTGFTQGYLRHLFNIREPLAARLLTLHNLQWLLGFLRTIQQQIRQGTFPDFVRNFQRKEIY